MKPETVVLLPAPQGTNPCYRRSRLVDSDSGFPVMIPVLPELKATRLQGQKDGEAMLEALRTKTQ